MAAPELIWTAFFSLTILLTASATARIRHVYDDIDLVCIEPLPGNIQADIGFVKMISRQYLDFPLLSDQTGILPRPFARRGIAPGPLRVRSKGRIGRRDFLL